jgi:hypothetical protein
MMGRFMKVGHLHSVCRHGLAVKGIGFGSSKRGRLYLLLLLAVSSCGSSFCQSVLLNPSGNQTIVQPSGTSLNVNMTNLTVYANNYSSIQAAIVAGCNGTMPGSIVLPVGTITIIASTTVPSNCTITGQGGNRTILQASTTLSSPLFTSTGSHILLSNFGVDCNRSNNGAVIDGIDLNSLDVTLDGVSISNCANNGLLINGNSSYITVRNGEIYNTGSSNPAVEGPAGIGIAGGPVAHISILNERVHDNTSGIQVSNSTTVGQDVSGINIANNHIYSNGNDAIIFTTTTPTGGNIIGVRVENNELYCNGWPAGGVGFSTNCTPGFQQHGSSASQGGVGVDLIQQGSASIIRPIVIGNVIHDNVFEGVSPTTNIVPIVNSSGRTITWVSGPKFNTAMHAGQVILLNGSTYTVASVSTNQSIVTTNTLPTLSNVQVNLPGYMGAIIANNDVSLSGVGTVGPCFYNAFSDGNIYSGNIATKCNYSGFENFYSSFTSYAGDKAYSNDQSGVPTAAAGFTAFGSYGISYVDIASNDVAISPTQTSGVLIDSSSSNIFIQSSALLAVTPVTDGSGTTTTLLNGTVNANQPVSAAAPTGACALTVGLFGATSTYSACMQPNVLAPGQVGWKYVTQDSVGGTQNPLSFDNIGGTVIKYVKPQLATTPTGSCSTVSNGTLALSSDGHAASCVSGTWTSRW